MAEISHEQQKLDADNIIVLFILDATNIGGSIFRFTSTAYANSSVVFDGNAYAPIDVEATGFEWNAEGSLPRPKLRLANTTKVVSAAISSTNDLLGAKVTRIKTHKQFLDGGDNPDPSATYPIDVYFINQKTGHNKIFVEFELASSLDQQGKLLPGRQVLKNACTHIYRVYDPDADPSDPFDYTKATCPYTDQNYFTRDGKSTSAPQSDDCGKDVPDCKLRFGEHGVLPTRAFPGVGRV